MNEIKLFRPLWWVLHALMLPAMFLLGHFVRF
jgi:hypothetical protein